ncbi:pre-mRNA-splicing factor 38B-like [Lecanosticta acicola]|uniref:Pre-mRNA-splicing factor 38B-like n=1 Tax=Lecanosticta acicola TaxID=111012 RepID=A0AAI8YWD1_9PEZI|nr:pre-mRNA-splicing factor 38B-like [Lecanosticta acicola]
MEAWVENGLEATNYIVDRHFDKGWDRVRRYRNASRLKHQEIPYCSSPRHSKRRSNQEEVDRPDSSDSSDDSSSDDDRVGERTPAATAVRSSAAFSGAAAAAAAAAVPSATSTTRPRQRNQLPSPERDPSRVNRRDSICSLQQESETSDRILRAYELETDDPKRNPESVLSSRDLRHLKSASRRDSAMASAYNDDYAQSRYDGERPRSQPPRSRYYDDDDSDYDERSGRRYAGGSGRGYDDRDYDRVVEETERYRGPPAHRPWDATRKESSRSGYDEPYGAGAVTQYGRRSDAAVDCQTETNVSRRSKSRGRDRDDRSYSRSESRSRSRSRGKEGWRGKLDDTFDTTARGLGIGVAGAVIGGLAGREFGNKHRQRDIILGAVVGGLGANLAENRWREWKDGKERDVEREEERWEQKYDGRDYGRSRSNVR